MKNQTCIVVVGALGHPKALTEALNKLRPAGTGEARNIPLKKGEIAHGTRV